MNTMKRWLIIDMILLGLLIVTIYGIKAYIEHYADTHAQDMSCPTWLADSPQERCR